MLVIASFTGRGIDVHEPHLFMEAAQLVRNLVDGVASGRVRGFIVQGAGVDLAADIDEALLSGELSLANLGIKPATCNEYNALRADGAHEEASEV